MMSPPVFLPLPVADSVQGPYPPLYGVRISHMGRFTHTELLNKVESKAFHLIDSPPLTDCLQPLTLRRNVASLAIFYRYFHANCSFELVNCMPPPLPRPRRTRFSTYLHPYPDHQPISSSSMTLNCLSLIHLRHSV